MISTPTLRVLILKLNGGVLMELSDRKLKILSAVVNNYIQSAEPVSSKILCDLLDFSISSATIRNELAELTELGFLEQPHTSAGRIPSQLGYRLYINKLMSKSYLSKKTKDYINYSLNLNKKNPELILKNAARLLANLTNSAVVSTNITSQKNYIRSIKLVQISNYTTMIILTTSSGIIKNNLFRCDFLLNSDILSKFNNILNEKFVGVFLSEITPAFIQTTAISLGEFAFIMSDVLNALFEVSTLASKPDFHFDGQTNLLLTPELNQQVAIELMNYLSCCDDISDLLFFPDNYKTRIFIGNENPHKEFAQSSIIVTKYMVNNEDYGALGIIGPIRMDYSGLIANLEYTAFSLGNILNNLLNLE